VDYEHEHRIYLDDYASQYVIVDEKDYQFLVQWRWYSHKSRIWPGTKKPKAYAARTGFESIGKDYRDENGKRIQNRRSYTIFLHEIVIERKGDIKPITNMKIIVDHADGDGFNCRRNNLRYATISFNNKNRFGVLAMQEML
jgi:hypothetical protein